MKINEKELEKLLENREEEVESVVKSFLSLKDTRCSYNINYKFSLPVSFWMRDEKIEE
jgi:hypothetical protein